MMIWDYAITVDHIPVVTRIGSQVQHEIGNIIEKHSGKKKFMRNNPIVNGFLVISQTVIEIIGMILSAIV
jgi:hypothetical protein